MASYLLIDSPGEGKIRQSDTKYDVAVLTMHTNHLGSIGSYMGALSVTPSPCTIDTGSTSAGYPAMKADGEMWSTGLCPSWSQPYGCNARIVENTCDISGGQSGSGVFDEGKRSLEL
jgi:V8-like Glu-specific endopeptidase